MIKKITLGLTVALSAVSLNSLASEMRTPTGVTVPMYNGGLTFGLAGLYLRPSTEALDYGISYTVPSSTAPVSPATTLNNGTVKGIDPDYDWGYRINIGYMFPCSGNDLSLTYSHFHSEDKNSFALGNNQVFFGSISPFIFQTTDKIGKADAHTDFRFQAVDLDLGQHINAGCNTHLRLFGGLRYTHLTHQFDANYSGTTNFDSDADDETFTANTTQKSKFNGIGPRFGIDSEYALGSGFGIVGQASGALLVGEFNNKFHERDIVLDGTTTDFDAVLSYNSPDKTRVVPNLSAKLGVNYSYQFCNPSRTKLSVEAGYQVDHFYNSAERLTQLSGFTPIGKSIIDTNFAGPYLGIQVKV